MNDNVQKYLAFGAALVSLATLVWALPLEVSLELGATIAAIISTGFLLIKQVTQKKIKM